MIDTAVLGAIALHEKSGRHATVEDIAACLHLDAAAGARILARLFASGQIGGETDPNGGPTRWRVAGGR